MGPDYLVLSRLKLIGQKMTKMKEIEEYEKEVAKSMLGIGDLAVFSDPAKVDRDKKLLSQRVQKDEI